MDAIFYLELPNWANLVLLDNTAQIFIRPAH